jgi:hypothetical protein
MMIKKQINMSSINNFKSKASIKKSEGIKNSSQVLFNPMGCPSTNGIPCRVSKFVNVMHGIFIK